MTKILKPEDQSSAKKLTIFGMADGALNLEKGFV